MSARSESLQALTDALRRHGVDQPDALATSLLDIFRTNARDMSCFICERLFPWDGNGKIPMCCGAADCHATRNARDAAEIEARTPAILPSLDRRPVKLTRKASPAAAARTKALAVKLTEEEHAQIRELARAAGKPMDGFVLPYVLAALQPHKAAP